MNRKKAYVSPQVTRVKLEPTQAVLSQCEVGAIGLAGSFTTPGVCNATADCKQKQHGGGGAATS